MIFEFRKRVETTFQEPSIKNAAVMKTTTFNFNLAKISALTWTDPGMSAVFSILFLPLSTLPGRALGRDFLCSGITATIVDTGDCGVEPRCPPVSIQRSENCLP